jgi:hypothetical protein
METSTAHSLRLDVLVRNLQTYGCIQLQQLKDKDDTIFIYSFADSIASPVKFNDNI